MTKHDDKHHLDTLAIHAGQKPDAETGAIMTPIYQTSTYVQAEPGVHQGYEYSRTDNPTRTAFQDLMAALEGGKYALAFSSGMATIDTIFRKLNPGDHTVVGNDVYGGTYRLFDQILSRYGLTFSYVDASDPDNVLAAVTDKTRMVWLETPTNPLMALADIEAISQQVKAIDPTITVAVDNTFASPYIQNPIKLGADIVMHSTTKYLGGHSDVVGGVMVLNDKEDYALYKYMQNAIGAVPGPQDVWLTMRGIKTLAVRMQRHSGNALKIARFMEDTAAFSQVRYPGLASHPQFQLAQRQMRLHGGMISVLMAGGEDAARRFVSHTKLFQLAESLGGIESLIEHPASMTHMSTADSDIAVPPNLVRFSVGIEHIDDLMDDIRQALAKL